ncbi:MAG: class I SAM-dependent methyltransferase [Thermoleophilia bacterium]|nr:class I SAM-dependent methyltransferase [Thermoleophilia bacterium]
MPTQRHLYERLRDTELDHELSWSESDLPERERTKHVHRLHPYLGKFVPQLVEIFLHRSFGPGQWILDPFSGSGTTLVECSTFGAHSVGVDISAFNALLARAKTAVANPFVVEHDLRSALGCFERALPATEGIPTTESTFLREWYDARALSELLLYRSFVAHYESAELLSVVLSRAARSARLTTHTGLDFPKRPQREPYTCAKHGRVCTPTREAAKFLRRYTLDTIRRVRAYERVRTDAEAIVIHGDARTVAYTTVFDGLITSPPYPGRIDYHEQHRYAYELFGLVDRREEEIGAATRGTSRTAVASYVDAMVAVFDNARRSLRPGAPVIVVVDDARDLYAGILERAGLTLEGRRKRHVNRRTGRRSGEFFEDIVLARA